MNGNIRPIIVRILLALFAAVLASCRTGEARGPMASGSPGGPRGAAPFLTPVRLELGGEPAPATPPDDGFIAPPAGGGGSDDGYLPPPESVSPPPPAPTPAPGDPAPTPTPDPLPGDGGGEEPRGRWPGVRSGIKLKLIPFCPEPPGENTPMSFEEADRPLLGVHAYDPLDTKARLGIGVIPLDQVDLWGPKLHRDLVFDFPKLREAYPATWNRMRVVFEVCDDRQGAGLCYGVSDNPALSEDTKEFQAAHLPSAITLRVRSCP